MNNTTLPTLSAIDACLKRLNYDLLAAYSVQSDFGRHTSSAERQTKIAQINRLENEIDELSRKKRILLTLRSV